MVKEPSHLSRNLFCIKKPFDVNVPIMTRHGIPTGLITHFLLGSNVTTLDAVRNFPCREWEKLKHGTTMKREVRGGVPIFLQDGFRRCQTFLSCRQDALMKSRNSLGRVPGFLWADHAAAAGKVRIALECLMDHLGVPKRKKDKNGKFDDLSLHHRVEIFQKGSPIIGSQLMAHKWLGNTGSHEA